MNDKKPRSELARGIARAWEELTEGWREMLSRSNTALTRFGHGRRRRDDSEAFPTWSVLAGECWETAHSIIVRVEVPGMRKEDLHVSIEGGSLYIRGEKRSDGDPKGRLYHLMQRAYGRFERAIALPNNIDRKQAEVTYNDGVVTVIVHKTEALPPQQLTVK